MILLKFSRTLRRSDFLLEFIRHQLCLPTSTVSRIRHCIIYSLKISTTAASVTLSEYLQTGMTIRKENDETLCRNKEYRRCWLKKSAEGV